MTETRETHILVEDLRIGWGSVVLMDNVGFAVKRGTTFKSLRAAADDARGTLDRTNLTADDIRRILPAARRALEQLRSLALLMEEQSEAILYSPLRKKEVPK